MIQKWFYLCVTIFIFYISGSKQSTQQAYVLMGQLVMLNWTGTSSSVDCVNDIVKLS